MATGIQAQRVTTTVVVKGQDKASAQIRKATGSLGKFERQAGKARAKMSELGSGVRQALSGDALGAVSSFNSALGGIGGPAGTAALAMAGVAAVGAAAAVAAYKLTQMTEETERFRVQARAAFAGGEEQALQFADQIGGVTVRSVVEFRSQLKASGVDANFSAQQLQNLANTAAQVGKTGDDALTAFAQAIRTGSTRALNSVGVFINSSRVQDDYAKSLGKTTTQLTQQEKQAALVAELQSRLSRKVDATNTVWSRQDEQLAKLSNNFERLKLSFSETFSPEVVSVLETINKLLDEENGNAERAREEADRNMRAQLALNRAYLKTVDEGTFEMLRSLKELGPLFGATRSDAVQFTSSLVTMMRRTDEAAKAVAVSVDDTIARFKGAFSFMAKASGLTTAFDAATGDKDALEKIENARKRRKKRRPPRRPDSGRSAEKAKTPEDEQRDALQRSRQLSAEIDKLVKAREAELRVEEDLGLVRAQLSGLADVAVEKMRIELELKRKLREVEGDPNEKQMADLARLEAKLALQEVEKRAADERLESEQKLAEAQQRAIELERVRRMEAIGTAGSIVDAAAALAQATGLMDKNDRVQRAILAARSLADASRETALAATAAATYNAPKAVAHGIAAAAHVAAAASYRSKSGGGGKAGSGRAASVGAVDAVARGGQRERGGNVTINLPPGAYIGTPAQLGAELRRLQLATAGTGV